MDIPTWIGSDALAHISEFLPAGAPKSVHLVADENTYQACGWLVEEQLRQSGFTPTRFIFSKNQKISADERALVQVFVSLKGDERLFLAVGSGTITDITRFVSSRARQPFLSIPTAASVDAYTAYTSALLLGGLKRSVAGQTAQAICAHLPTLCAAPRQMTGSGFGDMLAKFTALADWQMAHLLTGEYYDANVASRAWQALHSCAEHADQIGLAQEDGIRALIEGLMISGACMTAMKSSRPAAGAEHVLAHFWESMHHLKGLPESFHGAKTGVAAAIIAGLYQRLRQLSRQEAAERLQQARLPDMDTESKQVQEVFGPLAPAILSSRPSFLGMTQEAFDQLKAKLLEQWDAIQTIAASVPTKESLRSLLKRGGAACSPAEVSVRPEEIDQAIRYGPYFRERLTILELNRLLSLENA